MIVKCIENRIWAFGDYRRQKLHTINVGNKYIVKRTMEFPSGLHYIINGDDGKEYYFFHTRFVKVELNNNIHIL